MIRVGSTIKVQGTNNKGIVLDINQKSANVSINNKISSYALSDLEEEDLLLINRLSKNEPDEGLNFVLSVDAFRLLAEYRFNPYVLASSTKINIFPHQIDEVIKILDNPRMMIADEVGLGKTIIAALVATELRERGLANKILFVVPKSLVIKWKDELSNRFETESQIIDSDYLKRYSNPFEDETFSYIASMDFLKQKYIMKLIENHNFDLVVVDEAHKFSYGTDRFSLGQLISQRTNFLLFLTATPHNGDNEDFLQRMKLLDPYYHQISTISHLMTRNIKEDVIDLDGKEVFPPRESKSIDVAISDKEIKLHRMIDDYIAARLDEASNAEDRNTMRFLTTIIKKRASSSLYALKMTLEKRIDKLGRTTGDVEYTIREIKRSVDDNDEEASERNEEDLIGYTLDNSSSRLSKEKGEISNILVELESLRQADSKLELLKDFIKTTKKTDTGAKMLVFTEYRDTMNYLMKNLQYKVEHIDGIMNIKERNDALIKFRNTDDVEIMVCTDAAGEGIDMQFCNIEVNYDLPWNPNKLEQRMGRIHRIGQRRKAYYYNFYLNDTIDGYILSKLRIKIDNIKEAMGDKIYDIIGRLIGEEDIADLYEELLRIPREKWEAKIKRIDGIIEDKIRILKEINSLLSGYKFDRTKLEDMKKNFQRVVDKDEVKRFVEKYLDHKKGKLEPINIEEDIYRIFLPKQTVLPYGGRRVLEGTFRSDIAINKNYTYLALGNPYIMSLVRDASKPTVAVLKHPIYKDCMLMIYKITINDGKARERNGKVIAFMYSNGNVESIDLQDIWGFEFSSDDNGIFDIDDDVTAVILKNKEIVDVYADKIANDLLKETAPRLAEIESKTEESVLRYYIAQASEIDSKIHQYEQKVADSPTYSRLVQKETMKKEKLLKELDEKIDETKRDFDTIPVVELVGIAIINNNSSSRVDITKLLERPGFIPVYSELSRQNQQINSENSETTHARLQRNSNEWHKYHDSLQELRKSWKIDPLDEIIKRLKKFSDRLRIGDFGCGRDARIMSVFEKDRTVMSFDHIAINNKVIACDMKSVPIENGDLDVIVFSLSLMGKNWHEYVAEASRCLNTNGILIIADTTHSLTEGRLSTLRNIIRDQGFDIRKDEPWDVFTYIEAIKE